VAASGSATSAKTLQCQLASEQAYSQILQSLSRRSISAMNALKEMMVRDFFFSGGWR
jgi:hypothetical protein